MQSTWLETLRDRLRSTWAVLTGRAYAAYSAPELMSEVRLRIAMIEILNKIANRSFVDTAQIRTVIESALDSKA